MSNVRQISVFVENKPTKLAEAMKLLKNSKINIRAMALADTKDFGILRLIVNDTEKTVDILRDASYAVTVTEIVAISIPDSPGQLSRVLDVLGDSGVNIEYLYAFIGTLFPLSMTQELFSLPKMISPKCDNCTNPDHLFKFVLKALDKFSVVSYNILL